MKGKIPTKKLCEPQELALSAESKRHGHAEEFSNMSSDRCEIFRSRWLSLRQGCQDEQLSLRDAKGKLVSQGDC